MPLLRIPNLKEFVEESSKARVFIQSRKVIFTDFQLEVLEVVVVTSGSN